MAGFEPAVINRVSAIHVIATDSPFANKGSGLSAQIQPSCLPISTHWNLVELERIELSISACKADVFPLALQPRILSKLSYSRESSLDLLSFQFVEQSALSISFLCLLPRQSWILESRSNLMNQQLDSVDLLHQ